MVSSKAQRTIVKSPPELWTELSDAASLTRHLGELGEISITHLEPEQSIEWTAQDARGKVEITPSGWGTKVTLSVTLDSPQHVTDGASGPTSAHAPEPVAEEAVGNDAVADAAVANDAVAEDALANDGVADAAPADDAVADDEAADESVGDDAVAATSAPIVPAERRPERSVARFFERLRRGRWTLRRKRPRVDGSPEEPARPEKAASEAGQHAQEPEVASVPEPEVASTPEPEVASVPEPEVASVPGPDVASLPEPEVACAPERVVSSAQGSETATPEEQALARTSELLSGILDSLGQAHHRPFSRG